MPMSVDTDKLAEELPKLMEQAIEKSEAENLRPDPSLRHHAMVADMNKEGQGGNYWVVAGGDVVLFASTQVPVAERDVWNPTFQQVMASLEITRDDHLVHRRLVIDMMAQLGTHARSGIQARGRHHPRPQPGRVPQQPLSGGHGCPGTARQDHQALCRQSAPAVTAEFGHEVWEETEGRIVPVLKPRDYVDAKAPPGTCRPPNGWPTWSFVTRSRPTRCSAS